MAVPGPKFHKVKSFQHFFRKFLVFTPHAHFPEIVHPSATSPRRGAAGTSKQNPICAPNQMNGPPRVGADRISDRQVHMENFSVESDPIIWPRISRKADRESAYGRSICIKPIGLLLFSPIIIITYFFIKINPIENFSFFNIIPKKFLFVKAAPTVIDFIKKI